MSLSKSVADTTVLCLKEALKCSDTIHRGLPTCEDYFFTLFSNAILETTKFYTPLYLFSSLLTTRRFSLSFFLKKILPSIALSSLAVATHGSTFGLFSCMVYKITRTHHQYTYILSSILCATLSILIERKQRRPELAVYCCNHAVECVFRMLCCRGIIRPIRHGEELLFGITFAGLIYYYHCNRNCLPGSMTALFKLLLGDPNNASNSKMLDVFDRLAEQATRYLPQHGRKYTDASSAVTQHNNHRHTKMGSSCVFECIVGFVRGFGVGVFARFVLSVIPSILKVLGGGGKSKGAPQRSKAAMVFRVIMESLIGTKTLKFGAFISILAGVSKLTSCTVNSSSNIDTNKKSVVSTVGGGICAVLVARGLGLTSTNILSHELTMYLLSKFGEALFWDVGVAKMGCPTWKHGDSLLYIVACTILFYNSVYEPHNLRLSYWAFLLKMSNGWFFDAVKGFDGLRSEQQIPGNIPNFHRNLLPLLSPHQRQRDRDIDLFHKPWLASQ